MLIRQTQDISEITNVGINFEYFVKTWLVIAIGILEEKNQQAIWRLQMVQCQIQQ